MQKQMQYWICRWPNTWPTTWYGIAVVHSTWSYCFLTSLYFSCFSNQRQFLDPAPRATEQRLCDCRCFPLLVGTPGFMTQGKAGNQLGALRFSRGHFLQMMDAACRNISLEDYESFWNTNWVVSTAFWQHFDHFVIFCRSGMFANLRPTWEPFLAKRARCPSSCAAFSPIGLTGAIQL